MDKPPSVSVELYLGGDTGWAVAERYEVERDGGSDRIVAIGGVRDWYLPNIRERATTQSLLNLRGATDDVILDWVRANGHVGTAAGSERRGETFEEIRSAVARLGACRDLLDALKSNTATPNAKLELAQKAAGHVVDVDAVTLARGAGFDATADARRTLAVDLQALNALGTALAQPLRDLTVLLPSPAAGRYAVRLRPTLYASGPLAAAYVHLLEEAASMQINRNADGRRRLIWKDELRTCPSCGKSFRLEREKQKWCSPQCRWRQAKTRQRGQAKTTGAEGGGSNG